MSDDHVTIRRANHQENPYFLFARASAQNVCLSFEATGLLAYLLSKPDDWKTVIGDLQKRGGCGRDKIRRMIKELAENGYMEQVRIPAEKGKFAGSEWIVHEIPSDSLKTRRPVFPEVGLSVYGKQDSTDSESLTDSEIDTESEIPADAGNIKSKSSSKKSESLSTKKASQSDNHDHGPRQRTALNDLQDAIARYVFGAAPGDRASLNAKMGRVALILNGQKGYMGLRSYEAERQGVDVASLDYAQLAQDVPTFIAYYYAMNGNKFPVPTTPDKFIDWWSKWRTVDKRAEIAAKPDRTIADIRREAAELEPHKGII